MKISLLNSLRFRMPALILAGILPLILGTIFYAKERAAEKIVIEAEENLILKTNLLSEAVFRWNESNLLALINLSDRADITSMKPEQQKEGLTKLTKNYQHIYLAMTLNKSGWNTARSDNKKLQYYGDRQYFQAAIAGKNISYQALIGRTSKKPAMCISTPIRQGGIVTVGVTTICTRLDVLSEQIGKLRFGETGYAFVVDPEGKVLAHPNPRYLSGERLTNLSSYPPIKNALEKQTGKSQFRDRDKEWISYTISLENDWIVGVVQEKAEFLQSKTEFDRLIAIVGIVTIAGVTIVTCLVAERLIKPIRNLTAAAIAISQGKLNSKLVIDRNDELGILANSFAQMATQLNNSFQTLEKRIAERTIALKQALIAAESANQSKERFLVSISHELRTPLNSILGYTTILLKECYLKSDYILALRIVKQSGTHLLTLINDILDFTQTKEDKIQLAPEDCHFPKFLEEVAGIVAISAKEKGLLFESQIDSSLPEHIKIDTKRLRQVLLNLLGNAVKFTKTGKVTFVVQALAIFKSDTNVIKQEINFEIIDTGIGINPKFIGKIFQPFEQVSDEKNLVKGIGLGLPISQELVGLMGGKIKVKSSPNSGANFSFSLAVELGRSPQIAAETKTTIREIVAYKGVPKTILIVDDRVENRKLLARILTPKGFEVIEASNGKEGLEKTFTLKPDLILTDLLMPVKSGLMMIWELRKNPEFANIPIIAISASNQELMERKSASVGCQAFILKPFEVEELMNILETFLDLEWVYQEVSIPYEATM